MARLPERYSPLRLLLEHPEIRELELDLLRVNAREVIALDGLIVVDSRRDTPAPFAKNPAEANRRK
jgi:hypothetical protein